MKDFSDEFLKKYPMNIPKKSGCMSLFLFLPILYILIQTIL